MYIHIHIYICHISYIQYLHTVWRTLGEANPRTFIYSVYIQQTKYTHVHIESKNRSRYFHRNNIARSLNSCVSTFPVCWRHRNKGINFMLLAQNLTIPFYPPCIKSWANPFKNAHLNDLGYLAIQKCCKTLATMLVGITMVVQQGILHVSQAKNSFNWSKMSWHLKGRLLIQWLYNLYPTIPRF